MASGAKNSMDQDKDEVFLGTMDRGDASSPVLPGQGTKATSL